MKRATVTEIPEHLRERANTAKAKAEAKSSSDRSDLLNRCDGVEDTVDYYLTVVVPRVATNARVTITDQRVGLMSVRFKSGMCISDAYLDAFGVWVIPPSIVEVFKILEEKLGVAVDARLTGDEPWFKTGRDPRSATSAQVPPAYEAETAASGESDSGEPPSNNTTNSADDPYSEGLGATVREASRQAPSLLRAMLGMFTDLLDPPPTSNSRTTKEGPDWLSDILGEDGKPIFKPTKDSSSSTQVPVNADQLISSLLARGATSMWLTAEQENGYISLKLQLLSPDGKLIERSLLVKVGDADDSFVANWLLTSITGRQ
jgi:hypothetical protein